MSRPDEAAGAVVVCPRCGHIQDDPVECHQCGVIFSRFNPRAELQPAASHKNRPHQQSRSMEWKKIAFLLVLLAVFWLAVQDLLDSCEIRHLPGILIPYQPWQAAIANARPWEKEGRLIDPLADFRLRARVLGK